MIIENPKNNAAQRIKVVMANAPVFPIPKGEVWLGTDLLKQAGYTDTLDNHFRMAEQLDQDMICLPIADGLTEYPALGYRYFQPAELEQAVKIGNQFVAAVVDGPFQTIVNQMGLMELLMGWARNRQDIIKAYEIEQKKTLGLISKCLAKGAQAIVITDDFAADQGPLINPKDIKKLCTPFYRQAVDEIHSADRYTLLHSCGKITRLTELFKTWNIDGLAAVQHGANNLVDLHKLMGPNRIIMAGIDADLLENDPPQSMESEFRGIIESFKSTGGLILSSACGLYNGRFLERIKKCYHMADRITKS